MGRSVLLPYGEFAPIRNASGSGRRDSTERRPRRKAAVRLNDGRIVEATIRAVVDATDGIRLQVDYGRDETALIHERQIRKE